VTDDAGSTVWRVSYKSNQGTASYSVR
jgi:hypothetical protein